MTSLQAARLALATAAIAAGFGFLSPELAKKSLFIIVFYHWSVPIALGLVTLTLIIAATSSNDLRQRRFWIWNIVSLIPFLIGNVFETIAWINGQSTIVAWTDGFFYLSYAILIFRQLLMVYQDYKAIGLAQSLLDYSLVVIAGALVIWFLLRPDISTELRFFTDSEQFALLSFAILDVVIGFLFLSMVFKTGDDVKIDYRIYAPIFIGWIMIVMSDLLWHVATLQREPFESATDFLLFYVGLALFAVSADKFIRSPSPRPLSFKQREYLNSASSIFIYLVIYLTLLIFGRNGVIKPANYPLLVFLGLAILGILFRQMIGARRHARLTMDLAIQSAENRVLRWAQSSELARSANSGIQIDWQAEGETVNWLPAERQLEWLRIVDTHDTVRRVAFLQSHFEDIRSRLSRAITDGWFEPFFQPVVGINDGKVRSFEVLARCQHPISGMLGPRGFISLIEGMGLSAALVLNLIHKTFSDPEILTVRRKAGFRVRFAFNLTADDLSNGGLAGTVSEYFRQLNFDGRELSFELTERSVFHPTPSTESAMNGLRARGVSLYIDDFGTGFSSLSYLNNLKVDGLKIDQSFVRVLNSKATGREIVESILDIAKRLNLNVVAEGVEEASEEVVLRDAGCRFAQGYLYSPAVPAKDVPRLISRLGLFGD